MTTMYFGTTKRPSDVPEEDPSFWEFFDVESLGQVAQGAFTAGGIFVGNSSLSTNKELTQSAAGGLQMKGVEDPARPIAIPLETAKVENPEGKQLPPQTVEARPIQGYEIDDRGEPIKVDSRGKPIAPTTFKNLEGRFDKYVEGLELQPNGQYRAKPKEDTTTPGKFGAPANSHAAAEIAARNPAQTTPKTSADPAKQDAQEAINGYIAKVQADYLNAYNRAFDQAAKQNSTQRIDIGTKWGSVAGQAVSPFGKAVATERQQQKEADRNQQEFDARYKEVRGSVAKMGASDVKNAKIIDTAANDSGRTSRRA